MAGVKITDLTPLATAVSGDLLYIVDISDTTESPQGTSKQIEVGNMFSSGTYTPTITGVINGIIVAPLSATYIKVGNIVNCNVKLSIELDAGETTGQFQISLPVASNFTNAKQLMGLMQWSDTGILAEIVKLTIVSQATNNTCAVALEVSTSAVVMNYCTIQFQYEVL